MTNRILLVLHVLSSHIAVVDIMQSVIIDDICGADTVQRKYISTWWRSCPTGYSSTRTVSTRYTNRLKSVSACQLQMNSQMTKFALKI